MNPFLSKPTPPPGEVRPAAEESAAPVFVSGAALLSFPVACAVIKFFPVLIHAFVASVPTDSHKVMLITALFVGVIIFILNTVDANKPKDIQRWIVAIAIGVINTAFLLGAAIGIDTSHLMEATPQSPPATSSPAPAPPQK